MLEKCPECALQVSSKAATCPHCGYPLKPTRMSRPRATSNKRRRLPNGFGQISEIKGRNLRKPFRAMVTVGKSETGRPICKPLKPESYFATYNDAYLALVEYNRNPYDEELELTMQQLYERWSEEYFKKDISKTWKQAVITCWTVHCKPIHDMRVKDVRVKHLKTCVNAEEISTSTVANVKIVLNMVFDYALENDLTDKNYARIFTVDKVDESQVKSHIAFTDEEMKALWDNLEAMPYLDMILIQCYSGWRPQELCELLIENVDLENHTFKGGKKTKAGKNRVVPIHSKIYDMVKNRYNKAVQFGSKYLFFEQKYNGTGFMSYYKYRRQFDTAVDTLHLNKEHRPHDCRKQFITMAKKYNVDEYAIKHMVGHSISDITEKVYTERSLEWYKEEIEKIR